MSDSSFPAYHLATPDQWQAGLSASLAGQLELDPEGGEPIDGTTAAPLLVDPDGNFYWIERGVLRVGCCSGPQLGHVRRLSLGGQRLWALSGGGLVQLDAVTLHQLFHFPTVDICDIAAMRDGGSWLLRPGQIQRIDACARPRGQPHACDTRATQIAALGTTLALLLPEAAELHVLGRQAIMAIDLAALANPEFQPRWLSAGSDAFLVTGDDAFLLIDRNGSLLLRGKWMPGVTPGPLLLAGRDLIASLTIGGAQQLRRFSGIAGGGLVQLSPMLEAPTLRGDWLRAEVAARLPEGATLGVRFASIADDALAGGIASLAADETKSVGERLSQVQQLLDPYWSATFVYSGPPSDGETPLEAFGIPLHAAAGPLLWVEVTLRRNQAVADPQLAGLWVYPAGESLMDHLPAIFRGTGDRDGTLRRLVGVIEATTLGIDGEIARLAGRLDPAQTEDRWLGSLAAMLGLPFDAALSPAMQRGLLAAAQAILLNRGTAAGVRALLAGLFPGRPVRVVDRTELLAPITLGSPTFAGSRLPALLAGPTTRIPRLNARLVLGKTRLCPASACDAGRTEPPPELLVAIPATGHERRTYGEAVRQMIEAVIPAGVRLRLRWAAWHAQARPHSEEVLAVVDAPVRLRLGDDQALGAALIGGRRVSRIDGDGVAPATVRLF